MIFTALLIFTLAIPALIWLGVWIFIERGARHHGHPDATEGGSPTIYRHTDDVAGPLRT